MRIRGILAVLVTSMVASAAYADDVKPPDVKRPPQFVIMAFDGGINLQRWQDLSDFSVAMKRDGKPVHFTIFLSGIGLIENANRSLYQAPGQRRGYSAIGFGGSAEDVQKRVEFLNAMYASGHEIASHAMGHLNGARWSAAQWEQEFAAYRAAFDNAGPSFARASADKLTFPFAKIVGFRAPYLATGPGLYEALRHEGFRYDTSGISYANQWPQKAGGLWQFNLVQLKVAGRTTLSMDYNFFVAQSGARFDPRRADLFRAQMLATYLDYFRTNYTGNRAPLNIGHHFEALQGGVYNEALKDFARAVCGLPEVRCATYSELADFMDAQSPEALAAYQAGAFPHAAIPALVASTTPATTVSPALAPSSTRSAPGARRHRGRIWRARRAPSRPDWRIRARAARASWDR